MAYKSLREVYLFLAIVENSQFHPAKKKAEIK